MDRFFVLKVTILKVQHYPLGWLLQLSAVQKIVQRYPVQDISCTDLLVPGYWYLLKGEGKLNVPNYNQEGN